MPGILPSRMSSWQSFSKASMADPQIVGHRDVRFPRSAVLTWYTDSNCELAASNLFDQANSHITRHQGTANTFSPSQ